MNINVNTVAAYLFGLSALLGFCVLIKAINIPVWLIPLPIYLGLFSVFCFGGCMFLYAVFSKDISIILVKLK